MGIGLWNLGIDGFSTHVFWLAVLLILCLIFLILFLGVFLLYKIAETKLSIMYINEKSIKQNFRLIMQEQDKIRKINHDRKYEFQYLLECMEKEEYQKGKDYIIEKYAQFKKEQMVRIWTGCNGIDNLLNNAGSQAKKKCVELKLETEIMESPIKAVSYTHLGNEIICEEIAVFLQLVIIDFQGDILYLRKRVIAKRMLALHTEKTPFLQRVGLFIGQDVYKRQGKGHKAPG